MKQSDQNETTSNLFLCLLNIAKIPEFIIDGKIRRHTTCYPKKQGRRELTLVQLTASVILYEQLPLWNLDSVIAPQLLMCWLFSFCSTNLRFSLAGTGNPSVGHLEPTTSARPTYHQPLSAPQHRLLIVYVFRRNFRKLPDVREASAIVLTLHITLLPLRTRYGLWICIRMQPNFIIEHRNEQW